MRFLGSACGPGLIPFAPGTWGSAATVALVAGLAGVRWDGGRWGGWLPEDLPAPFAGMMGQAMLFGGLALVVFVLGCLLGNRAERDWGRKDPGGFVVDEVVGQLIPLLPLLGSELPLLATLAAFGLFRLFDILKPWPVRQLERLPGGVGIMADDVAAGLYAAVLVIPLVP